MTALIAEMRASVAAMGSPHARLSQAIDSLEQATNWIVDTFAANPVTALAGAVPYLPLTGIVVSGWLMVRTYEAAKRDAEKFPLFAKRRQTSVSFYARHFLVLAPGLADTVLHGSSVIADTAPELV